MNYNLANALKEEGEIKKAIESYRRVIELKPDFAVAYLNLGNIFKEEAMIEEAIESYREAIKVKPDFRRQIDFIGLSSGKWNPRTGLSKELSRAYGSKR